MVFCQNYNYDTIVLSFLNVFFDTANKDNMPGKISLIDGAEEGGGRCCFMIMAYLDFIRA